MRFLSLTGFALMLPMFMFSPADHHLTPNDHGLEALQICGHVHTAAMRLSIASVHFDGANDSCTCYCGGQNWHPGSSACMNGGFKYRCVDRGGQGNDCGWDAVKQGADRVPCDGGEQCNDRQSK